MAKKYYLKERHNPQFDAPYYIAEGQLTKTDAKKRCNTTYGTNYMLSYETEKEYTDAIKKLKSEGFTVH
jgi:hypothetical protein